ncbi:hypothetical protein QWZ14_21935 [Paeniroseomonas aquatica]|uniref:Uncharacterized protein n=1 Tax=Paeniroseomonas aquatica TaxID=373043 RepID=A0ABT8ABD6_9PROT|nr:hypothetical protein [Paeniroseomonas aquatica]MDN3567049.1 hypothetical protein [Paeniroseomonas aquatica]
MTLQNALMLGGALLLAACAGPVPAPESPERSSRDLLNSLPPRLAAFTAHGPATALAVADSAGRSYGVPGAFSSVVLTRPQAPQALPEGPEGAEVRVLLEQLTTSVQHRAPPAGVPPRPADSFTTRGTTREAAPAVSEAASAAWRREADQGFQGGAGTALRCSVLRRPLGAGAQVRYTCVTGLQGRFLTIIATVNHDAMNGMAVNTLVGNFAASLAEALATGEGLVSPYPTIMTGSPPALVLAQLSSSESQ